VDDNRNGYNGWLEPSGKFHPLEGAYHHCDACEKSGKCPCEVDAERYKPYYCKKEFEGWVKLTNGQWIVACPYKFTKKQFDFIFDWYIAHNKELDGFMELMKDKFL
jgi:hypothetical protein